MRALSIILFIASLTLSMPATAQKNYEAWLKSSRSKSRTEAGTKAVAAPVGIYTGTIPCADCQGIRMELTISGTPKSQNRNFTLKQTYLGKPAGKNAFTSSGIWFLAKGNRQDPKASVLQLIPKGNYEPIYLLQSGNRQLKMLDRQQNEIKSRQNYTLTKQ